MSVRRLFAASRGKAMLLAVLAILTLTAGPTLATAIAGQRSAPVPAFAPPAAEPEEVEPDDDQGVDETSEDNDETEDADETEDVERADTPAANPGEDDADEMAIPRSKSVS